jgi:hypothetical protein
MTPSEIVTYGFGVSPVVMMNEAHNGMSRCARTRRIGREILPAAHSAGCRHLAMEALPNLDAGPTVGVVSLPDGGYVAQPEMREFIEAARGLGWTLVSYEIGWLVRPQEHQNDPLTMAATNHRELVQAENVVAAWHQIGNAPMLVWCGNSHHAKRSAMDWTPMGVRFVELAGIEHFAIDQTLTIAFAPGQPPCIELTDAWRAELDVRGGTAGFVTDDSPEGLDMWLELFDGLILSTDNEMIGDPPLRLVAGP